MLTTAAKIRSVLSRSSKLFFQCCLLITISSIYCINNMGYAATPGLPLVEDFADTTLRDQAKTNANWSTEEQALILAWKKRHYDPFSSGLTGSDITAYARQTFSNNPTSNLLHPLCFLAGANL